MRRNPPLPYEPLSKAADMHGLLYFPLRSQRTEWTCGPACVSMVAQHFGKRVGEDVAAEQMGTTKEDGTTPEAMAYALAQFCSPAMRRRMTKKQIIALINHKQVPVVVLWDDWKGHWAVIVAADRTRVLLADPANRKSCLRLHTWKTFLKHWPTKVAGRKFHNLGIACYT
jgi:subfamily B ATP-binding cassette protein HlyB/CyaB